MGAAEGKGPTTSNGELSEALSAKSREVYDLTLYVTGLTRRSTEAIKSVKQICCAYLGGRCDLKIVDLLQHPEMAKADQIFAVPTLVKRNPRPTKRLIGDMSNTKKIMIGLDLE